MAYSFGAQEDYTELDMPNVPHMDTPKIPTANNSVHRNGAAGRQNEVKKKFSPFKAHVYKSNGNNGGTNVGEQRFDVRFKVLLLGNSGVGKTSLLRTLIGEPFNPGTISTIGIDLAKKIFNVDNNRIQLEVWDTAGQEQYFSIVALHFREAKAFIVVYDVTSPSTFDQIRKYWLHSIDQNMDEPVPVFFAANKADLTSHRKVSREDGEKLAEQQSAHGYFETSAKSGENVNDLFQGVADSMVSTWGAPKRWYEVDTNGYSTGNWPNQYPGRPTVNLSQSDEKPLRPKCCIQK